MRGLFLWREREESFQWNDLAKRQNRKVLDSKPKSLHLHHRQWRGTDNR